MADTKIFVRITILFVLLFILLFLLTFTGTVKCSVLPFWCDLYYSIKGHPRVAIIYGDDGLGDPIALQQIFSDRTKLALGAQVTAIHLNNINPGNLKFYELVIVTRAKTMSTDKMKMFIDFAIQGGKLIWTGDAGTKLEAPGIEKGDFLYADEDEESGSNEHKLINPWARKLEGRVVKLNELLGVNFEGTYCEITNCNLGSIYDVGNLTALDRMHPLVRGIKDNLKLRVEAGKDFAIVSNNVSAATFNAMVLDLGANLIREGKNYGKSQPFIVVAGKSQILGYNIGENIAYYAMPLEYFVNPSLPEENRYYSFIENVYYGMIYGNY